MLRLRRGERWAQARRGPARLSRWMGHAVGFFAAWGLAGAWAQAAPPPPPKSDTASPSGTPSGSASPSASSTPKAAPTPTTTRRVAPSRTAPPPPPGTAPPVDDGASRAAADDSLPPQDLSGAWGYTRRGSPRPRYVRNTQDPIIFSANPVGFYSGVSVQGNQLPPHPVQSKPGKAAVLTWAGFERTATGSRVFFQLSDEAEYSVTEKDGLITIKMKRTKVNVRNNLRRLDLSYFKTPVQTVKVRRRGRDAVATLRLKRSSAPEISYVSSQSGSGYKLLVVSFSHGAEPSRANPE